MKVDRILGRGAFATVYYCLDISLSRAYAVKVKYNSDTGFPQERFHKASAQELPKISRDPGVNLA
jgi:serine/threonine protein kinase